MKIRLTNYHLSSPLAVLHYLHIDDDMASSKGLKTIAIDKENYLALRRLGYTGESFNTVIARLIRSTNRRED